MEVKVKTRFPILSVRHATVLAVVAGSIFGVGQAKAGPTGEKVVRGQAAFQRNGGLTTITAANNTIINYKSFNIGSNESVQFVQPGADSRVLNRINSTSPTKIDGGLTANGQVYLVNPSGIVFGKNSVVNVNGMYAAAGRISDKDFLKGINHFTNVTGPVINQGMLSGENVTLVGRSIQNHGQIIADGGMVTSVVGNDVLIREGNGQIFVKIDGRNLNTAAGPASGSATAPKLGNAAIDNSGDHLRCPRHRDPGGGRCPLAGGPQLGHGRSLGRQRDGGLPQRHDRQRWNDHSERGQRARRVGDRPGPAPRQQRHGVVECRFGRCRLRGVHQLSPDSSE